MNKKALRIFFILIALLLVVLCSVSCTDSYLNDESNKFKTPSVSDKTPGATVNVPDNAKGSIKFGLPLRHGKKNLKVMLLTCSGGGG